MLVQELMKKNHFPFCIKDKSNPHKGVLTIISCKVQQKQTQYTTNSGISVENIPLPPVRFKEFIFNVQTNNKKNLKHFKGKLHNFKD